MKNLKRFGLSLLLLLVSLPFSISAVLAATPDAIIAASTTEYVNVDQLNVRSEPYLDVNGNNVIGVMQYGDMVNVESTLTIGTTQWCEITYKDYAKAYVDCQYLSFTSSYQPTVVSAVVNAEGLNVRSQTRKADNILGTLPKGTTVTVKNWRTDVKIPWCEITYKDHPAAFVVCRFLDVKNSVPEPVIDIPNPGYLSAKALLSLNIRSTAEIPAPDQPTNVIGSFAKDQVVQVKTQTIVPGQWCEVVYKDYAHAYVDCGYLEKI